METKIPPIDYVFGDAACEETCKDQCTDKNLEERWPGLLRGVEKPKDENNAYTSKREHNAQWLCANHCYSRKDVLSEMRCNWRDEERNEIGSFTTPQN